MRGRRRAGLGRCVACFSSAVAVPPRGPFVLRGTIVHAPTPDALEVFECGEVEVDAEGVIVGVRELGDGDAPREDAVELGPDRMLIPGLVDAHAHAPQYEFMGSGFGMPLLQWLETYTFPTEASYAIADASSDDAARIRARYERVVSHSLRSGTTTCSYNNVIDTPSSLVLADVASAVGQRALIGKMSMDTNAPDYYREESADAAAADARAFVEAMLERYGEEGKGAAPLVMPVVTPRFAPTCTASLLRQLGALADEYQLRVQSHLSENVDECLWVLSDLFPGAGSYAEVYEEHGLLTPRTYLAHGVFSTHHERRVMAAAGASVVHCASSNANLISGFADVCAWREDGVTVALGTDVAGGSSISMLTTARRTFENANSIAILRQQAAAEDFVKRVESAGSAQERQSLAREWIAPDAPSPLTLSEVLYMATRGGAKALSLDHRVGTFEKGLAFDALLARFPDVPGTDVQTNICLRSSDGAAERLEKLLFLGDDRNVDAVYVQGVRRA